MVYFSLTTFLWDIYMEYQFKFIYFLPSRLHNITQDSELSNFKIYYRLIKYPSVISKYMNSEHNHGKHYPDIPKVVKKETVDMSDQYLYYNIHLVTHLYSFRYHFDILKTKLLF